MFFEKNIQALTEKKAIHSDLLRQLEKTAPLTDLEVYETQDGDITLRYKDVMLHNQNSPVAEARQVIEKNCRPDVEQIHVVLGLGLGYLPNELFQASKGKIMIYESDLPMLRFVLENIDLSQILGSGRVWLSGEDYQMMSQMRAHVYKDDQMDVLVLQSHAYLLAGEIPGIMQKLLGLFVDRKRDMQTCAYYHHRWIESIFTNYPYFSDMIMFDDLRGRFEGKPAVVIGSGPSLDEALPALKTMTGNAVLIAVGGALRRLNQEGITPDFAVFYDAIGMKEQLHGLPEEYLAKIPMILSFNTQPCCFEAPSNGKILIMAENGREIARWLDSVLGRQHFRLEGGGSVSIIAFQAALAMGCDTVILTGQDLAYPNNVAYAGGATITTTETGGILVEQSDTLYVEPTTGIQVKGQNGEMLLSNGAYEGFIRHYEDMAVELSHQDKTVTLYNASLGGAHINGFELKALSELCNGFPQWKQAEQPIWEPAMASPEFRNNRKKLEKGLNSLKKEMEFALHFISGLHKSLPATIKDESALPNLHKTVETAITRYFGYIKDQAFLPYFLMFDMFDFSKIYQAGGSNQAIIEDYCAFKHTLGESVSKLRDLLLPLLNECQRRMNGETPIQAGETAETEENSTAIPSSLSA